MGLLLIVLKYVGLLLCVPIAFIALCLILCGIGIFIIMIGKFLVIVAGDALFYMLEIPIKLYKYSQRHNRLESDETQDECENK